MLRACGEDDVDLERHQFARERRKPLELYLGIPVFSITMLRPST
jgi:hypothetical protein